jgi:hypothetical protein
MVSNMELCGPCDDGLRYTYEGIATIHETFQSFITAVDKECYICHGLFYQLPEEWRQKFRIESSAKKKLNLHDPHQWWFTRFHGERFNRRFGNIELNLQMVDLGMDTKPQNLRFWFYPVKATCHTPAIPASLLWTVNSTSTNSEETFLKIRAWLDRCESTHAKCRYRRQKADTKWHPSRLVEIVAKHENVTNAGGLTCRMVEIKPDDNLLHRVKYATLSHRWPESDQQIQQIQKLTKENLPQWKTALPVNTLRQIFQDAFVVAYKVDLSYIWIDTLCIMQDDQADWNREAPMMHKVYSNAVFNICASRPNQHEESEGLFSRREPSSFQTLPRKLFDLEDFKGMNDANEYGCDDSGHYLIRRVPPPETWDRVLNDSPLASRGWIFQEQLLSVVNVHFGSPEIVFECLETKTSETSGSAEDYEVGWEICRCFLKELLPIPIAKQGGPVISDQNRDSEDDYDEYRPWHDLLNRYTGLQLTKSGDRLVALSGVAQYFKEFLPFAQRDTYVAGLWKSRLATELLWESASATSRDDWKDIGETRRPMSFSWVSIVGRIQHQAGSYSSDGLTKAHLLADMDLIHARISRDTADTTVWDEQPVMEDIFSLLPTQSIELRLKGILRPILLRTEQYTRRHIGENWPDLDLGLWVDGYRIDGFTKLDFKIGSPDLEDLNKAGRIFLMPLVQGYRSVWLLLLERVETNDEVNLGRFRRIGIHKKPTYCEILSKFTEEYRSSGDHSMRHEIFKRSMAPIHGYTHLTSHDEDFSTLPCWQYDE